MRHLAAGRMISRNVGSPRRIATPEDARSPIPCAAIPRRPVHGRDCEQLLRALQLEKNHEHTKDNLLRLQNGKKMNMKKFGMTWYGLQFENLPASMRQPHAMSGRRGLRQRRGK